MQQSGSTLRFAGISLDCPDPAELADFYVKLLDGELLWSEEGSAGVRAVGTVLVAQLVANYAPPVWPGASIVHLDLTAGDSAEATERAARQAVALGARVADPQPDPRWVVLLDPAGHPFCITPFAPE